MAFDIQYPYAYDENNRLVFIDDVDKSTRREHQYHCPNCGQPMLPRLGIHNAKHFAHDHHKCGIESYLHKMAKLVLAKRFNEGGMPFTIKLSNDKCKNAADCKDFDRYLCCAHSQEDFTYKEYCLSDHYKVAVEEEHIDHEESGASFRSDITLKSDDPRWKDILVEINYKHKSSPQKLESGLPIIEFDIEEMSHLKWLETLPFATDRSRSVHLYGFKTIPGIEPKVLIERIKKSYADDSELTPSEESLPMCGRSEAYFRNQQSLRRITLYKSGKTFQMGIYREEIEKHHPSAVMDITYDSAAVPPSFDPMLVFVKKGGKARTCDYCHHCVVSGMTESTFCNIGKNGTTWKGTFNDQKGTYCKFFEWRRLSEYELTPQREPIEGLDYTIWINPSRT